MWTRMKMLQKYYFYSFITDLIVFTTYLYLFYSHTFENKIFIILTIAITIAMLLLGETNRST